MISLLQAVKPYIDKFIGIRISTRPDCIDKEILKVLKQYGVTSIELGAQSMVDDVLMANNRGHNAVDVVNASKLIKDYGFSLGLQMMTGLYKSDYEKDIYTAKEFIKLKPDTVRVYPTVIMKNTDLEIYYKSGDYIPYLLEKSVDLCSEIIMMFENKNINLIRLGLHYSDSLVNNSVFDNYHPAFKELCESKILFDRFISKADKLNKEQEYTVYINEKSLSKFYGQKKSNLIKIIDLGYRINTSFDNTLEKYDLYIK